MSNDDPNEETKRLDPTMFAKKAREADAKAEETPVAPPINTLLSKAEDAAKQEEIAETKEEPKDEEEKKEDEKEEEKEEPKKEEPPAPPLPFPDRAKAWARRNLDHFIGSFIGLVYVAWLLGTARSLGFSRDEGFYFDASSQYERWFKAFLDSPSKAMVRNVVDGSWGANHEHPALMKSLFALSHLYFFEKWKIFTDQSTAFRFPTMVSMGVALWVTYLFATRLYSRRAGIVAAVALGLMPNVFYNAHLACFDVPIMAMWILCIYTYWVAEKKGGVGWAILAGIVYGLTLETKHNAWMLPGVFLPHVFLVYGRAVLPEATKRKRLPIPLSIVSMATIGPLVFIALWPWLWNDTYERIQGWVAFHLHHDYYNIEFLGVTYFAPPSPPAYMPVMIAATVPTITLVLFAIGAIDRLRLMLARLISLTATTLNRIVPWPREKPDADPMQSDVLIFLALCVPLAVFLLPRTPIFGGTKHWLTAYPALAIFAGRGFDMVATKIEQLLRERTKLDEVKRAWAIALTGALTFVAPFAVTRHSHPFGLSAYVPFFGGTAGGADLGLNRQFWGFTTESLGPWFTENTKPGDTVYIMDTAWQSWIRMVDEKRVPPWLRGVGSPAEAEYSIVHHEQHINEIDYNIWTEYGIDAPVYVLTHDGVPIISVYQRPHGAGTGGTQRMPPRRRP